VGDRVLLVSGVLPECPAAGALPCRLEQRVITEPAAPARLERDPPARGAAPDDEAQPARRRRVLERQGQGADVASAAVLDGHARELTEELGVVLVVRRVRAGVAPRPDAGRPSERLDLDARVVGECRQARQSGREPGLDPGVRLEGQAVLDGLTRDAKLIERDEVRAVEAEEGPELPQLVRGSGGDGQPSRAAVGRASGQRRTEASAVDCASNRRARPVSARSRSVSTRLRSKGTPSAVPWSSMYVPESVPTTFMSTSAWESSE
jgi:hypothetical protein